MARPKSPSNLQSPRSDRNQGARREIGLASMTGVLVSAGSNARGQLANLTLDDAHKFTPCSFAGSSGTRLPSNSHRIVSLASGANHTLVLLERGEHTMQLWGSGDGTKGQLGPFYLGDVEASGGCASTFRLIDLGLGLQSYHSLSGYTCKLVAAGWETSYIVLSCPGKGDLLVSMGADDFGDLGVGRGGKQAAKPICVVTFEHLIVEGHPIHSDSLVIDFLAAGSHHVVVHLRTLSRDGSTLRFVAGWGTSRHGQLGRVTSSTGSPAPFVSSPVLISTGTRQSDPPLPVSCALGNQHTVFLIQSGHLLGLGSDRKCQLLGLTALEDVRGLGCTWNGTYAIIGQSDSGSAIFATGASSKGQLGRSPTADTDTLSPSEVQFPFTSATHHLRSMACGSEHVLALFEVVTQGSNSYPTEVWGWGWNEHGTLGVGTTEDVHLPVKLWPGENEGTRGRVVGVWAGCGTSWIALES